MFESLIAETASRLNLSSASVTTLIRELLGMMTNERAGGPEGFLDRFHSAGLGDIARSWLGGGKESRAITAAQAESALGTNVLGNLAASTGLTRMAVASAAAFLLPKVIGMLTPHGTLPSSAALLSKVSNYVDPPIVAPQARAYQRTSWPSWLPWAAAALLALVGWLALRAPAGTIDPQLTVRNLDGKVTYSGLVRDDATRTTIVNGLRTVFGEGNVQGSLRVDSNVKPTSWLPRIDDLLAALRVPGAGFSIDGTTVSVGGWLTAAQRQSLTDSLRGIFGAQSAIGSLGDAAVEAVREANAHAVAALSAFETTGTSASALVNAMNLSIINFASGSAEIPADGMEVIRTAAKALKRAPAGSKVEIGGHTDNTGDPTSNIALSQARADAVRNALVAAGVPPAVLTTRGYGDSKPRAANETEFGRFQNRRIEYSVVL